MSVTEDYAAGWRAGWLAAMDYVHCTVSQAIAGGRPGGAVAATFSGLACDRCGHTDYCDGACSAERENGELHGDD